MNKRIGPKVNQECNRAIHVLNKHNSLPLGPKQPLSPSTKDVQFNLSKCQKLDIDTYKLSAINSTVQP